MDMNGTGTKLKVRLESVSAGSKETKADCLGMVRPVAWQG